MTFIGVPRRVRLRIWWQRRVDRGACRLAVRGHHRLAVALWRAFRMWS